MKCKNCSRTIRKYKGEYWHVCAPPYGHGVNRLRKGNIGAWNDHLPYCEKPEPATEKEEVVR